MRRLFVVLFLVSLNLMKSQCGITSSVTLPSSACACDGSVTIQLSPSCTNFPYRLVINGGICLLSGTVVINSPTYVIPSLCQVTCNINALLTTSVNTPIGFTNFTVPGGSYPVNAFPTVNAASCFTCCNGNANVIATGGTGPYTYTWTNSSSSVVSTSSLLTNACPGNYTLCAKDLNGCMTCTSVNIGFLNTIEDYKKSQFTILNFEDEIRIESAELIKNIYVYDLTGRLVYELIKVNQKEGIVRKSNFIKGAYVLYVEGASHNYRKRIVLE